jgi:hypothetical protein
MDGNRAEIQCKYFYIFILGLQDILQRSHQLYTTRYKPQRKSHLLWMNIIEAVNE